MKYLKYTTEAEAIAKIAEIEEALGIPDGKGTTSYCEPIEQGDEWAVPLKQYGSWKTIHLFDASEVVTGELSSSDRTSSELE
jgi:hypothetical protein